ncbi:MAG: hypothetical protein EA401_03420 [Planctomycetota bacterium]|nr:MAG: hypothetical protein EA401_03420 [Planctomycetota bacterium]
MHITLLIILLCCLGVASAQVHYHPRQVQVDVAQEGVDFQPYWNGTGFTPGNILLRQDMHLTLDYQAAIPNQGMRYVRPHWLLNMVSVRHPGSDQAEYDFSQLFQALDVMIARGMKPIFEIMGYPRIEDADEEVTYDADAQGLGGQDGQWVPDFSQRDEYLLWHQFVKELITALEERYGSEELQSWYFESTNEPDIHEWFWKQGIPALLNYWDATSEAIKSVNPDYVFGGPGTATVLSDEFKAVLAHCDTGTNAITGEQGSTLDFISVHAKNTPYSMIDMEMRSIDYIREHHPRFVNLPFWNNEADPTWGWRRPFWWRPTPWYAGFIVQSVDAHNRLIMDAMEINYGLLVNDKGFLGDWYTRTALARFANEQNRDQFWMIKKPVHNAMSLLAHMGGQRLSINSDADERDHTSIIPVRNDQGQLLILLANMPKFGPVRSGAESDHVITPPQRRRIDSQGALVELALEALDMQQPVLTHVRLDGIHANPYAVWRDLGSPEVLDRESYALLASHMEPAILQHQDALSNGPLRIAMSPASVSLLVISDAAQAPEITHPNPEILSINHYHGQQGERGAFIRWQQASDAVVAYDVFAAYDDGDYEQVNSAPIFDLGFLHVLPEGVEGVRYSIRVHEL